MQVKKNFTVKIPTVQYGSVDIHTEVTLGSEEVYKDSEGKYRLTEQAKKEFRSINNAADAMLTKSYESIYDTACEQLVEKFKALQ